jgi:hypothetical protein
MRFHICSSEKGYGINPRMPMGYNPTVDPQRGQALNREMVGPRKMT